MILINVLVRNGVVCDMDANFAQMAIQLSYNISQWMLIHWIISHILDVWNEPIVEKDKTTTALVSNSIGSLPAIRRWSVLPPPRILQSGSLQATTAS